VIRTPCANVAASPKENLMAMPVEANVVRISVDQMPLLLRRLEGVLPKERWYAQPTHVRSQDAGSTGRRNTGVKSLCWGFKLQGLTWPFV
jgi:hypothetical protein